MTTEKMEKEEPTPAPTTPPPTTPEELKEKGNECMRRQSYLEAVLHYTHAIKLTPNDARLYSNRSVAFLKSKHLYYANEDADKAIALAPEWAKGYFRKAEVQEAAGEYDTALLLYSRAMRMQHDPTILNAAKRVAALSNREAMFEKRIPWVGAGVGIVLGAIICICDYVVAKSPSLKHPSLMLIMVMAISGLSFFIAKFYRHWMKLRQRGLLDPPVDAMDGISKKDEAVEDLEGEEQTPNRTRYTKAQARQRFKKGKT